MVKHSLPISGRSNNVVSCIEHTREIRIILHVPYTSGNVLWDYYRIISGSVRYFCEVAHGTVRYDSVNECTIHRDLH